LSVIFLLCLFYTIILYSFKSDCQIISFSGITITRESPDRMKTLDDIVTLAKKVGPKKIAVAQAEDEEVLVALEQARREKIVEVILVGKRDKIENLAERNQIDTSKVKILEEAEGILATRKCCELVNRGEADLVMKGLVGTAHFMKAILDKQNGLCTGGLLSHVAVFEIKGYTKLLMITDPAINIAPSLGEKARILQYAIDVAHSLGIRMPKVACIAPVEKVYPDKMPSTLDGACLSMMARRGQITGAVVDGPLGLDNAISAESARIKGIKSQVSGDVDILLCPDIQTGNAIYKTITSFAKARSAALVVGTKVPVVLTSRADSHETKFISIAFGVANCRN
jgi:phosphate butyryltransferase